MMILSSIALTVGLFALLAVAAFALLQLPAYNGNNPPRESPGNRGRARQAMANFDREWAHWATRSRET